ncbi:RsmB/NOP family class I SAM-dependent RNA methyltransferase [Pedobacter sp. SYSU D00535]|uniref:RsmB/NOP family class I SAM-dependent RNA methyltransferase n=1 Tax=Pedobacter sp. SYSU D00535 TaxID=2810308 RepID=UPI001A976C37|nr:RsmB/NOP family class I SAM-dependent RNA methyltransferase [Pedobacter sp. SYSU D00535]
MRFEQQLKTFLRILDEYSQDMPLTKFLPVFFRANRQMGSNDRRTASRLLYNYFRLGKAVANHPSEERLFLAEFLCSSGPSPFLAHFKPELHSKIELPLFEKVAILEGEIPDFQLKDVYPLHAHLSGSIDKEAFLHSLFIQPDLFIRIHPGKENLVKAKLEGEGVLYQEERPLTLRMPNGTKLDQLFPEARDFEVQDLSSQQAGDYFRPQKHEAWWDCCAASGGKSLLLFQQEPSVKLVVSDVRESVLENLDERFRNAGLVKYQKKAMDLTKDPAPYISNYEFDGIILDAPCSGSGTWGRSPEMISQFREARIKSFQHLQQSIAKNVVKYLKTGQPLIYITCSAFKEENEEVVNYLVSELGLTLEHQQVLKGYERKADTMFVARLIK